MEGFDLVRVKRFPDGRLDRKNAAAYLGYAPKTLAEWACKGTGPKGIRVGGRIFYFQADLDAWVMAQRPLVRGTE
jgi:predicted DNA-binding transcriptional regulator AlpA